MDGLVLQLWVEGTQVARFDAVDPACARWVAEETQYGEDHRLVDEVPSGTLALRWGEDGGRWGRKARALGEVFEGGEVEASLQWLVRRATPTIPAATRCTWSSGKARLVAHRVREGHVEAVLAWTPVGDADCDGLRVDPKERSR